MTDISNFNIGIRYLQLFTGSRTGLSSDVNLSSLGHVLGVSILVVSIPIVYACKIVM